LRKACIFCEIVKGHAPATIIHQDEHVVAFLPKNQTVRGHIVVAPARHWATLFTVPEQEAAELMKAMKRLAGLLKRRLGATGVNILHASGKDAQQSVMHLHFHLFPRFRNDGIDAWPPIPEWHGDIDALAKQLRGRRRRDVEKKEV
jgi:histidine triad (HIT) family protein